MMGLNGNLNAAAQASQNERHTFVAYVEDKPGVLARVTSLFRRHAYNIESLAVGRTDVPGVSLVSLQQGDYLLIFDAGSGIRRLDEHFAAAPIGSLHRLRPEK